MQTKGAIIKDLLTGKTYFVEDFEKLKRPVSPEQKERMAWNLEKGFLWDSREESEK